jgi:hypothetical protein
MYFRIKKHLKDPLKLYKMFTCSLGVPPNYPLGDAQSSFFQVRNPRDICTVQKQTLCCPLKRKFFIGKKDSKTGQP